MLWKALTLAAAALALWSAARRLSGLAAGGRDRPSGPQVEDLARCGACGGWRPRLEPCACATPPTP